MVSSPQANRCCAALRLGDGERGVALQRQVGRTSRGRRRMRKLSVKVRAGGANCLGQRAALTPTRP
jgi:hypothetical protein